MIAIVDYGTSNLLSLKSALEATGRKVVVTSDALIIKNADKIILPTGGNFPQVMGGLKSLGLDRVIKKEVLKEKPLLGIGLGMQLLFAKCHEDGIHDGLGLIYGDVIPISQLISLRLKIPHRGEGVLQFTKDRRISQIFKYITEDDPVYFLHSYAAVGCEKNITATVEYGVSLTAAVSHRNVYGCQFHPEKSGLTGLSILQAFCEIGE